MYFDHICAHYFLPSLSTYLLPDVMSSILLLLLLLLIILPPIVLTTCLRCGATHWSMGNLLMASKQSNSLFLLSHQLPVAPQLGVDPQETLPTHTGCLTPLYSSRVDSYSLWFHVCISQIYPLDISQIFFLSSSSFHLSAFSSSVSWALDGNGLIQMTHLWSSAHIHLCSVLSSYTTSLRSPLLTGKGSFSDEDREQHRTDFQMCCRLIIWHNGFEARIHIWGRLCESLFHRHCGEMPVCLSFPSYLYFMLSSSL